MKTVFRTIPYLLLLGVLCLAQEPPIATPVDTYGETDKPDLKLLEEKTKKLAKLLKSSSQGTRTAIVYYTDLGERNVNFCSREKLTAEIRSDSARKMLTRDGIAPSRIVSIDGYLRRGTEIHFWLVPPGADLPKPMPLAHIDCECATIAIAGPATATRSDDLLTYTAKVSGGIGDTSEYAWKVSAGRIHSGQGSPSILVRLDKDDLVNLEVTVTVKGANACCEGCIETFTHSTTILR